MRKGPKKLGRKSIRTCGDQHLSKQLIASGITSVSPTTTAGTPTSTFSMPKMRPLMHTSTNEAWMKTQHNGRIKSLRSDRGGEYLSEDFSDHLKKAGTTRKLTVHDTPEYNGVAERLNCTIITKVRAMLHDSDLPKFLWGGATHHAVYLKNRRLTRTLGETTPFEILTGKKPDLSTIHPWGCRVRVHDTSGSKLDGRSKIGRWMGLDEETGDGHRIYWPERRVITVEMSVKFNFEDEVVVGALPLEGEEQAVVEQPIS